MTNPTKGKLPMLFNFRDETANTTHKLWCMFVKNAKLPRLSKPACEVTPIFSPVETPAHVCEPFIATR